MDDENKPVVPTTPVPASEQPEVVTIPKVELDKLIDAHDNYRTVALAAKGKSPESAPETEVDKLKNEIAQLNKKISEVAVATSNRAQATPLSPGASAPAEVTPTGFFTKEQNDVISKRGLNPELVERNMKDPTKPMTLAEYRASKAANKK